MENQQEQGTTKAQAEDISSAEGTAVTEMAEENKPQEPVKSDLRTILKAVLASSVVSAMLLVVYDAYIAQKIVALDVKGYIAEQRDLFMGGKISEEQLKRNFDRLEAVKDKVRRNRVIIMGDVLVKKNVEVIRP